LSQTGSSNNESSTKSANRSFKKSTYVKIPSSAAKSPITPITYNNSKTSDATYKNSENGTYNRSANTMNNESPYSPTYHGIFNYDTFNANNYNNNNNQFFYTK